MPLLTKVGILGQRVGSIWSGLSNLLWGLASKIVRMWRTCHDRWIRKQLPTDLYYWRAHCADDDYRAVWNALRPFFSRQGYTLWTYDLSNDLTREVISPPSAPGHWFMNPFFGRYKHEVDFFPTNGRQHALRGQDKKDYIVSVASIAGSSNNGLKILRRLSDTKPDMLLPSNHILPIVDEFVLEDIVFVVYPLLKTDLEMAIFPSPNKTIEDQLHIALQVLEATNYIHSKNIAHRDLFMENFVIEWQPSSIRAPCSLRPRVYLIDFETAVEFDPDVAPSERVCHDLPFPEDVYKRPKPSELSAVPRAYCPFRLDMWQVGYDFARALSKTGIPSIDMMWAPLCSEDPKDRPTALEMYQKLRAVIITTPPETFMVPSRRKMP